MKDATQDLLDDLLPRMYPKSSKMQLSSSEKRLGQVGTRQQLPLGNNNAGCFQPVVPQESIEEPGSTHPKHGNKRLTDTGR